ncbi:inorganic diphosphatase [Salegentibacter salarius]|uniref:inorganic diphosphatase n=1 Tax=Salegentibacter salarius TaxID=435906 RepID=A0A2N0U0N3_9FLAO|nr:inorganic diphosphatase [Salegentibacter salarius]OEY73537.1 inorganic pyrophosphatase [Salegentibacter salarius]PKD20573.1 inorganic pyrophosphatase [Salegentibacter salarius]SLJ95783.1 inorganic pyrophosphatase [Salegentibacter salarius]
MKSLLFSLGLGFLLVFSGCKPSKDLSKLPGKTESGNYLAVIEIPAGTNKKIEYHKEKKEFLIDQRDRKDRIINFLPYPGNYGFIPSTFSNPKLGGDGDAADVLVLGESLKTGSVIEIIPIAVLKLIDEKELDYKIIAIPAELKDRIIISENYQNFTSDYPEVIKILESWFTYYDKSQVLEVEGWGNETEAIMEIEKWSSQP